MTLIVKLALLSCFLILIQISQPVAAGQARKKVSFADDTNTPKELSQRDEDESDEEDYGDYKFVSARKLRSSGSHSSYLPEEQESGDYSKATEEKTAMPEAPAPPAYHRDTRPTIATGESKKRAGSFKERIGSFTEALKPPSNCLPKKKKTHNENGPRNHHSSRNHEDPRKTHNENGPRKHHSSRTNEDPRKVGHIATEHEDSTIPNRNVPHPNASVKGGTTEPAKTAFIITKPTSSLPDITGPPKKFVGGRG